jgi:hypothetical protein
MANAEMTIRLVDATEEEQSAIDNTPTFNNDGLPNPHPVQSPKADANKSTGANAKEGSATDVATSKWADGMDKLRDAMLSLYERFTPKAFQEPIERLINALDPRDDKGNTLVPPPVQTDTEARPMVDHVRPQAPEQNQERTKETDSGTVPRWVDSFLQRSTIGRRAIQTYQNTRRNVTSAMRAAKPIVNRLANTSIGRAVAPAMQKAGGFAKATVGAVARKLGFPSATSAATGAARAGASAATATSAAGAAAKAGAGAAGGAAGAGMAALANPVAISVAGVAAAFAGTALAAKKLSDAFLSEAERLTNYSGPLAVVEANRQVNTELNMIDRAKQTEGPLSSFGAASNNVNSQMEKLWTQVLSLLLKMEPALTTGANVVSVTLAETTKMVALLDGILAAAKASAALWTATPVDDAVAAAQMKNAVDAFVAANTEAKKAWAELRGDDTTGVNNGVHYMFSDVLSADLDDQGNMVPKQKKHRGAHGGRP